MSSRIESLPCDILQHIAFLSASASVLDPPTVILHLLQTCSTIYRSLNLRDAPNLYAAIFSSKFDRAAASRRYLGSLTDSALAGELVHRYLLLRRVHHSDVSIVGLLQHLWTALWMLLENDGLNMQQLSNVNFSDFILSCSSAVLRPFLAADDDPRSDDKQDLKYIIVWLLCLSLRRRAIQDMSKQDRDALYRAIFPFVFLSNKITDSLPSEWPSPEGYFNDHGQYTEEFLDSPLDTRFGDPCYPFGTMGSSARGLVPSYLKYSRPILPDISTASINIISVINEAMPPKIPTHLPETRAIAIASQRSGPTQEDYRLFASYRTYFFADLSYQETMFPQHALLKSVELGSAAHDLLFCDALQIHKTVKTHTDVFRYIPGALSALWEGIFRTLNVPIPDGSQTSNRPSESASAPIEVASAVGFIQPIQCKITEYICPTSASIDSAPVKNDVVDYDTLINSLDASGSQLFVHGHTYQKYRHQSQFIPGSNPPYDVILLGETLENHSHAWGGYKFSGMVHKDGSIVLRREAASSTHQSADGVWMFIGRLQSLAMIIGRWRVTGAPTSLDHGVFSMGRSRQ